MTHHLVVVRQFLGFNKGDVVLEAAKIAEILTSDYRHFVTKVAVPNTSKG